MLRMGRLLLLLVLRFEFACILRGIEVVLYDF